MEPKSSEQKFAEKLQRIKLTSSSTSSRELLNIQLATVLLLPIPSSRAVSSTDARRAFESRFIGSALVLPGGEVEELAIGRGLGIATRGRGNVKFVFI